MKKVKKILAALLSVATLSISLSGCGDNVISSNDNTGKSSLDNSGTAKGTEPSSESTAMGRYVEKTTDLSGTIGYASGIYKLEDGSLIIADTDNNFLITEDNGETWRTDERDWKTQLVEENNIRTIAIGKDNTVGVIYDTVVHDPSAEDFNPFEENLEVMIVKPDGTQVPVQITMLEEEEELHKIWIADSGRIFVSTYGPNPNLYEIEEDGSARHYLSLELGAKLIQFQNNLMIIDGEEYNGLLIYDMDKEKYIEDEVLNDFIQENYKSRSANGGSNYDLFFFMGEENVLYLAGKKGLHRHVIGGSAIEQVVDGNLSIFNNPSYMLRGMTALNNSEFIALFTNDRLVHFVYNPDIPTVPNERLKVYSLRDNSTVRQAMNLYQSAYPEVYVEYEVGIEESSPVTRDDALKNLNTKIAAEEGPDIIILDNMPADSYIEKGLLLDVSPILESLEGEDALFENIVDAFREGDKIYMIPCEVQLPVVFGGKTYTSRMADLEGIADAMESLRDEKPGRDLCGFCTKESIMRLFAMISVPYWTTKEGEVDEEGLKDYLTQIKRIYDIQMDGLREEDIKRYHELNEMYQEIYGYSLDESSEQIRMDSNYIDYVMGLRELIFGTLAGDFTYAVLASMQHMPEYEGTEVTLMSPDIFYPQTLTGISAVSENMEQAENFLRLMLGKENQSSLFWGLAVNKAAFGNIRAEAEEVEEDEVYSSMGMRDKDGNVFTLVVYAPDTEALDVLESWMETVSIPYIEDDLLEEAVYQEGAAYLEGTQSLEDTLGNIKKKVALFMAE